MMKDDWPVILAISLGLVIAGVFIAALLIFC